MSKSLKLKKSFAHSTSGNIVPDSENREIYVLEGGKLFKIQTKELKPVKQFNIDQKIVDLAIHGDDIALLSEKKEILYFSGESLLWRKQISDSDHSTVISQFLLYFIILGFLPALIGGMWLTLPYGLSTSLATAFVISIGFVSLFYLFTETVHREAGSVYLAAISGYHKNDVILFLANKEILFFDRSDGTLLKEIELGEKIQEAKLIKIVEDKRKQQLWIRSKKNSDYYALSLGLKGVTKTVDGVGLVEVFDWNKDGEYELVSASRKTISMFTEEGSKIFEIESPHELLSVASGDVDGDTQQELVLLAGENETYYLSVLREKKIRSFKLPITPFHLELIGIKDSTQGKGSEIVLRAFKKEETKILGYSLVPK